MTQNETYAVMAAIALIAYTMGAHKAQAKTDTTTYDPMGWLHNWAPGS